MIPHESTMLMEKRVMTHRPSTRRPAAGLLLTAVLAAMAIVTLAAPLSAQQTDGDGERVAPDFRVGQWGAQFTASSNFVGAGVLLFRSPQTAWTLDGTIAVSTSSSTAQNLSFRVDDFSNASADMRLGLRRYGVPHGPIRSFHGAGMQAGFGRTSRETLQLVGMPAAKQTVLSYRVGAFGEVGASYFITNHLALGARGVGSAGYKRSDHDTKGDASPAKQSSDGVFLNVGPIELQVSLFF